jgi:uncharacterized lipoprotein YajG
MRIPVLLIASLGLAACSADPKSLGITGPGPQIVPAPPSADMDSGTGTPGVSTTGSYYGPSVGPIKSNSGFYGYN